MKKILITVCAIMIFIIMIIPVSANTTDNTQMDYNGTILPAHIYIPNYGTHGIYVVVYNNTTGVYSLFGTNGLAYTNSHMQLKDGWIRYNKENNEWVYNKQGDSSTMLAIVTDDLPNNTYRLVWTSADFYIGTTIFMQGTTPTFVKNDCDGSSCPANDLNADGICDDCGGILVFQETPQKPPSLVEMMAQIPMTGVLREMIVILPCLIVLLTGFLALRKAIEICHQLLSKA